MNLDESDMEKKTAPGEEEKDANSLSTSKKGGLARSGKKDPGGRRAVMFKSQSSMEEVRRISRISSRSLAEVVSYWGTSDEHQLRKQELRQAATEMQMKRRMSDNLEFTSLGLADKVGEGKMVKKQNRYVSREAVLDEQDLQYQEGIVDDDLLADVYSSVTYGAQKEAADKAAMLHEEVKKFWMKKDTVASMSLLLICCLTFEAINLLITINQINIKTARIILVYL